MFIQNNHLGLVVCSYRIIMWYLRFVPTGILIWYRRFVLTEIIIWDWRYGLTEVITRGLPVVLAEQSFGVGGLFVRG